MPFQNHLQFDKQWDFTIPIILCTFLGLAAHIDLLIRVTIFWNGPPNYRTSEIFHHERNLRVPPMPETLAMLFNNPPRREVVEAPVQVVPVRAPAYDSWAHYFQQHPEMHTNWQSQPRASTSTRPLQVRPRPRPFTPHPEPEVVDVSSNGSNSGDQEMEEMRCGDTVPNTPEHPTTPLEQMEEDDMRRLNPILPSNAALNAASDNGILLTDEQHRVLTSQMEGSTILYRTRENRQEVEGDDPCLSITDEERGALRATHDALQFVAGIEGTNATPGQGRITDLIRPRDPPILQAFAQELENWPEVDQFLEEAFQER